MAKLRTPEEIAAVSRAGQVVSRAHLEAARRVRPGITPEELDAAVEATILDGGASPLFKGTPGPVPFPAATCISVNDALVHGIPGSQPLSEGDIVSIDIGAQLDGWCADAALTHAVGSVGPELWRLLQVTSEALDLAIELVAPGVYWNDVARRIQGHVEAAGFSVVEGLCGHGIGREMWEPPQFPNYYTPRTDVYLQPGMVFAIEPMVNLGDKAVRLSPDGWTIVTADGKPSAHFEHTVAITESGVEILTAGVGPAAR